MLKEKKKCPGFIAKPVIRATGGSCTFHKWQLPCTQKRETWRRGPCLWDQRSLSFAWVGTIAAADLPPCSSPGLKKQRVCPVQRWWTCSWWLVLWWGGQRWSSFLSSLAWKHTLNVRSQEAGRQEQFPGDLLSEILNEFSCRLCSTWKKGFWAGMVLSFHHCSSLMVFPGSQDQTSPGTEIGSLWWF